MKLNEQGVLPKRIQIMILAGLQIDPERARECLLHPELMDELLEEVEAGGEADFFATAMKNMVRRWRLGGWPRKRIFMSHDVDIQEIVRAYEIRKNRMMRLSGGGRWDVVDWMFPKSVIAETMRVTRQAVSKMALKKEREIAGNIAGGKDYGNAVKERARRLSAGLNLPPEMIEMICQAQPEIIAPRLLWIADAPLEKSQEIMARLLEKYGNPGNIPDTIQMVMARKGVDEMQAARLILAAIPDQDKALWALLDKKADIPEGETEKLMQRFHGQYEDARALDTALDFLPDVARSAYSGWNEDDIFNVASRKGISLTEAVRLLFVISRNKEDDRRKRETERKSA